MALASISHVSRQQQNQGWSVKRGPACSSECRQLQTEIAVNVKVHRADLQTDTHRQLPSPHPEQKYFPFKYLPVAGTFETCSHHALAMTPATRLAASVSTCFRANTLARDGMLRSVACLGHRAGASLVGGSMSAARFHTYVSVFHQRLASQPPSSWKAPRSRAKPVRLGAD